MKEMAVIMVEQEIKAIKYLEDSNELLEKEIAKLIDEIKYQKIINERKKLIIKKLELENNMA